MWKECYRIGIEGIDRQHMELFHMVEGLLGAIESRAGKEEFRQAIEFMKNYVVSHFKDEEAYQASIHYSGMEAHKKMHREFTDAVLEYEKMLIRSDYDIRTVKELAGTLMAWLIYHVADADQKIANGEGTAPDNGQGSYLKCFSANALDVLEKMAGLDPAGMAEAESGGGGMKGDAFVKIGLLGDIEGQVVFGFSEELAFKLIEIMAFSEPEQMDEFVCSALAEIANIASGNTATELSGRGILLDITPPTVTLDPPALGERRR